MPWQCGGMGNGDYVAAFQHVLLPIAMEFNPDLIIASAGELGRSLSQMCVGIFGCGMRTRLACIPRHLGCSWQAVGTCWLQPAYFLSVLCCDQKLCGLAAVHAEVLQSTCCPATAVSPLLLQTHVCQILICRL